MKQQDFNKCLNNIINNSYRLNETIQEGMLEKGDVIIKNNDINYLKKQLKSLLEDNGKSILLNRIDNGLKAHEEEVLKMSDEDLYHLVYDEDYNPEDFSSKELVKRNIEQFKICPITYKNIPTF